MANKLITEYQLRSEFSDDCNLITDDNIQTYRTTGLQVKNYILAPGNVGSTEIADGAITMAKLASELLGALIPTGSVMAFAAATAPAGYLICDGAAVSRTTYAALFAIIGVTHGQGDNINTFNLPDYRGRFLRGADGSANRDPDKATRTASNTGGQSGNNVGSVQTDAFQGHVHADSSVASPLTGWRRIAVAGGGTTDVPNLLNSTGGTGSPIYVSDGTRGVPRAASETRPMNAYVNYVIKI